MLLLTFSVLNGHNVRTPVSLYDPLATVDALPDILKRLSESEAFVREKDNLFLEHTLTGCSEVPLLDPETCKRFQLVRIEDYLRVE